jgi:excisionase family DNA binding protein
MNPMESGHEILTVKEVSSLLRVHPVTLYRLTKEGKIPSFRIGTDWRFRRDEIKRWMVKESMEASTKGMRKIRVLPRAGHELSADVRDGISLLRKSGIRAQEGVAQESWGVVMVEEDGEAKKAIVILRAKGFEATDESKAVSSD